MLLFFITDGGIYLYVGAKSRSLGHEMKHIEPFLKGPKKTSAGVVEHRNDQQTGS